MNKYKFKDLSQEIKNHWVSKLLNLNSFTDEENKYSHTYRVLKMLTLNKESCKHKMMTDYGCSNQVLVNKVINITDSLYSHQFETNSPFVDIYCTYHIDTMIQPEDDLILYETNKGAKKYVKLKELRYYYFRLNKRVFSAGGYDNSTARNYFLSSGFKQEYKNQTNRNINPHKIALFNRILNKYDLIRVYQVKKKPNLYVFGKKNPCYWFEGIMETKDLAVVDKLIRDNKYHPVNLTPKDLSIKNLEGKNSEKNKEIEALKKEIRSLKKMTEQVDVDTDNYRFLIQRNDELLNENAQYIKQQQSFGPWNIAQKPNKKFNFDEKFKEIIKSDSCKKADIPPESQIYSEEEEDSMKKLQETVDDLLTWSY